MTAASTSDLLRPRRYREVRELRWGERARVGEVGVRAIEVNHWGARMRTDTYRGYNGYIIEAGRYRILFGGDTAMTSRFPLGAHLTAGRSGDHAHRRLQSVDSLSLHSGASLADGQ